MPRGDGTGPGGAGQMTGRGMGSCAGSGRGGSLLRGGGGLGLLGAAMWMFRLWNSGRQRADAAVGARENEAEERSRTIAELEGSLSELRQRLDRVKIDNGETTR